MPAEDVEVDVAWPDPEPWERPEAAILERILTQHWDMATCACWVCTAAGALGYRPREKYLRRDRPLVKIGDCWVIDLRAGNHA